MLVVFSNFGNVHIHPVDYHFDKSRLSDCKLFCWLQWSVVLSKTVTSLSFFFAKLNLFQLDSQPKK